MESMGIFGILIASLLTILIGLVGFLSKRVDTLLTLLRADIDRSHKRHDITDIVVSTIIKDSFNSDGIAMGRTNWPRIFRDS